MSILTQKELRRILHYDPDTGIFTRVVSTRCRCVGSIAGTTNAKGYTSICIHYKRYFAHRLAFLYMEGYFPENEVDHIDRNPTNNKWKNLREVSRSCNGRNCKVYATNKSGITGVYWGKERRMWISIIMRLGNNKFLGEFDNKLDAAKARWEAEKKYGYPNCNTTSSAYQYIQKYQENR